MFYCFKYFVLLVTFNHCCGASHLIPTAIYGSPPQHRQPVYGHQRPNVGPHNSQHNNHYSVYEMPYNNEPKRGELQYSASFFQSVQVPRVVNPPVSQVQQVIPQAQQAPQQTYRQVVNGNTEQRIRSVSNFEQQRLPSIQRDSQRLSSLRLKDGQQLSGQTMPKQEMPQKQMMPMLLRAEQTASNLRPMLTHENHMKPNFSIRSRPVMRVSKMDPAFQAELKTNLTESNPRIHSIGFNWPKAPKKQSENRDNSTQLREANLKPSDQLRASNNDVTPYMRQEVNDQNQVQIVADKRKFGESQQNIRFEVTESPYQTTAVETEIRRDIFQTTTERPTTVLTTLPYNYNQDVINNSTNISLESDIRMDRKESLSSVDSELNYQTQFYDPQRPMNHFEPSISNDQVTSYESLAENPDVTVPENEVNYAVPEPEPISDAVNDETYYEENDKDLSEENGPKLKNLLEQFIQQLDLLKFVAAKELQKSGATEEYSSNDSPKDGEAIRTTVAEPKVSRTGLTYDDYQNQRSFEQSYSNSDSKAYKDTHEKRYGRYDQGLNDNRSSDRKTTQSSGLSKPVYLSTSDSIPKKSRRSPDHNSDNSEESLVSDITLSFE